MPRDTVPTGLLRTIAILASITLGAFIPAAHGGVAAVRWLIMGMLFMVFLGTQLSSAALHRSQFVLLGANIAMGFIGWGLGAAVGGHEVALAGFFAAITPTASAAPVIMSFLRGRVDYVITCFLLTNLVVSALLPGLLPLALGRATPDVFARVAGTVGLVVFVPLAGAWLLRAVYARAAEWPRRYGNLSFLAWLTAMFLITANASHFIRTQADAPRGVLLEIAAVSAIVCATNFALGRLIGGTAFPREASQALGQKNTALTIYLAMTYASPLVALGPTCYVVWHNLWNSWQLHRHRHTQTPN